MVILKKHSNTCELPMIGLIGIILKNTLITINYWPILEDKERTMHIEGDLHFKI